MASCFELNVTEMVRKNLEGLRTMRWLWSTWRIIHGRRPKRSNTRCRSLTRHYLGRYFISQSKARCP